MNRRPAIRRRSPAPRRGVAVLLVLLLLSITLGLSYAMVRTQNTAAAIGRNADRRTLAREAALTGLSMAYQNMFSRDWSGVSTSFSRSVSSAESFSVTYMAGDPTLTSSSPDYRKYPYRVTLLSTGTSIDPSDSNCTATHTARAIVQLVPQALVDEPSCWSTALNYTLYQYYPGTCYIAVPFRATGPVRFDQWLNLGYGYNWTDTTRNLYIQDLYDMKTPTSDWRPFDGPVTLLSYQKSWDSALVSLLTQSGISTSGAGYSYYSLEPSTRPERYRLYPGGPEYTVGTLAQDCRNASWLPDPVTNPLGAYVRAGTVNLYDNAVIQGTVLTTASGSVNIRGTNVQVTPVDLLPLHGTTAAVRLPIIIAQGDLRVCAGASGTLKGMATSGAAFQIDADDQNGIALTLQLKIAAASFIVYPRSNWEQTTTWWNTQYNNFKNQGTIAYFPDYLQKRTSLVPEPKLLVTPDTTAARYHWNPLLSSVYTYPDSTRGLSWEVVQWTDNP